MNSYADVNVLMRYLLILILFLMLTFAIGLLLHFNQSERLARDRAETDVLALKKTVLKQSRNTVIINRAEKDFIHYQTALHTESESLKGFLHVTVKHDKNSLHCIPDDVSVRLLAYADKLHPDTPASASRSIENAFPNTTSPSCRLTYGQVIYWNELLLTALGESNKKIEIISDTEQKLSQCRNC